MAYVREGTGHFTNWGNLETMLAIEPVLPAIFHRLAFVYSAAAGCGLEGKAHLLPGEHECRQHSRKQWGDPHEEHAMLLSLQGTSIPFECKKTVYFE